jgi:hypothetical protein
MRTTMAAALLGAAFLLSGDARAQGVTVTGPSMGVGSPVTLGSGAPAAGVTVGGPYVGSGAPAAAVTTRGAYAPTTGSGSLTTSYPSQNWAVFNAPAPSRTFYYSYYAAPGVAAREYVGPPEFPFYGRPYGHPTDRWSWANLSAGPQGSLARYYYAPVR